MERLVITMPIAPYEKYSLGKMTTPILAETLSKIMNAKFILSVNLLDSYKTRFFDEYQNLLKSYGIIPDEFWIDKKNVKLLLERMYYLIDKGFISLKEKKILSCSCKKVEISEDNLSTINIKDSCFEFVNGKYYCKSCKSLCTFNYQKHLIFNPNIICSPRLLFYPNFINKDIKTFWETVGKNEIVISRNRETGIKINYNNEIYNIDIDFLWQMYLSLFNSEEKIVICSNHQLYQLFMVSLLENCFGNNGNTICLATPYLNIKHQLECSLEKRLLSTKLVALLNLKWSRKENNLDEGLIRFINSMNVVKKQQLYDILTEQVSFGSLEEDLHYILTKRLNIQNANQELKRRRRNV